MIIQLIAIGAGLLLGVNASSLYAILKGNPYPEGAKALSGITLAIALLGFVG